MVKSIGVIADEIITELGYQSVDKKLDRRNVIVRLDAVRTELMGVLASGGVIASGQTQIRPTKFPYEFNDVYYITSSMDITFDCNRGRYVSEIPTDYVTFESNSGIRLIRPKKAVVGSNYFIHQKLGASLSYGSLESSGLGGMIGFEIEGKTIWWNNMPANMYESVLITYIPTLLALKETDMLPCTGEFASILLDITKQKFIEQLGIQEDKVIDSTSNP